MMQAFFLCVICREDGKAVGQFFNSFIQSTWNSK
jgi:hypothetical protein